MARPTLEVADIFRAHGPAWRRANAGHVSLGQLKVMSAIERCRTAALGASGAVERPGNTGCGMRYHHRLQLVVHREESLNRASVAFERLSCASVGVISARVKAARQWIDEGYIAATDGKKVGHRAARFRVTDRRR